MRHVIHCPACGCEMNLAFGEKLHCECSVLVSLNKGRIGLCYHIVAECYNVLDLEDVTDA